VRHPSKFKRRLKRAVSPEVAFIERNHDPDRTLLLVGTGRSGTTWLAEVLTEALHSRLMLEPLRSKLVPMARPFCIGHYVDPAEDPDPVVAAVLDRIMTGRIRGRAIDRYNAARFPRCRVVKEVRATNLLPWIVGRYPRTPVVYLLRHPVPTAWSVAKLGLPDNLDQFLGQESLMRGPLEPFGSLISQAADSDDRFHRRVLRWCLENFVPTHMLDPDHTHVIFYEHMIDDPWGELERLRSYLSGFGPGLWDLGSFSEASLGRPSHTNYHGTDVGSGPDRLETWVAEVPAASVEKALELVGAFGLRRIYSESTRPLVPPDAVLQGDRRAPTGR